MKDVIIQIPEDLEWRDAEIKRFLAAKLYEIGKLSLGQAAVMAGLSKRTFSEILADYDVSLINYSAEDISKDASRI